MTRLERIRIASETCGVSLEEFIVLDVVGSLAANRETTCKYVTTILHHPPSSGSVVVQGCIEKDWLKVSPSRMLALTPEGAALTRKISSEIARLSAEQQQG
jgi:hypothetical protein